MGHCSIHSRYFAFMIFLVLSLFFWLYHSFKKQPTSSKLSKSRIASIGTLPPQSCSQSYQINVRIISSGVSALVKKFSLQTFRTLAISWILSSLGVRNPDSYWAMRFAAFPSKCSRSPSSRCVDFSGIAHSRFHLCIREDALIVHLAFFINESFL